MAIYLVRHTPTILPKTVCYGQLDVELQKPYSLLFDAILEQLPTQINTIYSSPLIRCKELANFIAKKNNTTNLNFDDRLKELSFGDWEGKAWDIIPPKELNPWMEDFVNIAVPNGESFKDLYSRSIAFFQTITNTTNNVVVISHAGVIRSVLCYLNNKSLVDAFSFKCDFGEVIRI